MLKNIIISDKLTFKKSKNLFRKYKINVFDNLDIYLKKKIQI